MTGEERQLPPDSGHLDPATASGWLETQADPIGHGGWQPPHQGGEPGQERPRRSASAEAAAIRLFDLEQ
jgi:hypothetical protein